MMNKIRYLLRCIAKIHCGKLFRTISEIHNICGKNRLRLLFDIIWCGFKYGAGYSDYALFAFYDLTAAQRATYVTRGINNEIMRRLNDSQYAHIFDNKNEFYTHFSEFLGRTWLYLPESTAEEFHAFVDRHTTVIVKPASGSCGQGVRILHREDFKSPAEMYAYLRESGADLAEEVICQHPVLRQLNPNAVSTIRVGTLLHNGTPHILYAFIRIGNGSRPVDNINAGGMCAPVDLIDGRICLPACDKNHREYSIHPDSQCPIVQLALPFWPDVLSLCLRAAQTVPQMGYIGWDVAITENGPVFVEGNHFPGHDILQMPPHLPPDRTGFLPTFRKFIPDL